MKLSEIIIKSSPKSVEIFFQAMSQPSASNDVMDKRITSIKVGMRIGKPRTGSKEEFLPALAAMAETRVNAEAIPTQPNSRTQKNMKPSFTGFPNKSDRKTQPNRALMFKMRKW